MNLIHSSFCWATNYTVFGLLVISAQGFKAGVSSFTYVICYLYCGFLWFISELHLLTSWHFSQQGYWNLFDIQVWLSCISDQCRCTAFFTKDICKQFVVGCRKQAVAHFVRSMLYSVFQDVSVDDDSEAPLAVQYDHNFMHYATDLIVCIVSIVKECTKEIFGFLWHVVHIHTMENISICIIYLEGEKTALETNQSVICQAPTPFTESV